MFNNIEKKIKGLAKVLFIVGMLVSILLGIIFIATDMVVVGLVLIFVGLPLSLISSWLIYGFGELIENTGVDGNYKNANTMNSTVRNIVVNEPTFNSDGIMNIPKRTK